MMVRIHRTPGENLLFWFNSRTSWKRLKNPDGLHNLKTFLLGLLRLKIYDCSCVCHSLLSAYETEYFQPRVWRFYPALVALDSMRSLHLTTGVWTAGDFMRAEVITENSPCWRTSLSYSILGAELSAVSFLQRTMSREPSLKITGSSGFSRWHGFEDSFRIATQVLMGKKVDSFIFAGFELDKDFKMEQPKSGTPFSAAIDVINYCYKLRCQSQPFSGRCWMQRLGLGLYQDKAWNFRNFYTLTTGLLTEQKSFEGLGDGKVNVEQGKQASGEITFHDSELQVTDACRGLETNVYPNGRREISSGSRAEVLGKSHNGECEEVSQSENEEADEQEMDGLDQWAMELKQTMVDLTATLKDLESRVHPNDEQIGIVCLRLAQVCDSAEEDPAIILSYSERALKILGTVEESVQTAVCLQVMGSAYYKLKVYDKSLAKLEHAAAILEKIEMKVPERKLWDIKYSVHVCLGHAKTELGMDEEALQSYFESLSINERCLEPGHPELAMSYQQVAEVCMEAGKYNEAKPLCLKALKIFQNFFGQSSSQATIVRRLLALIYTNLEEYEKVLEEHEKIRLMLEAHGLSREVAFLDLSTGEALLELGRHEDMIPVLGNAIKVLESSDPTCGLAMVYLGKAYAGLKRYKEAKHYCNKALNCFSKSKSVEVAKGLVELASLHQELNDVDEAIFMYRKALSMFECSPDSEEAAADVQSQLGMVLLFKGRIDEAMAYMDKAIVAFRNIFGPENKKLLFLYNHMGISYMECEKLDDAVDSFERARKLSLSLFGPDDPCTIGVYQNLVNAYAVLGRYDRAIEYQNSIVEAVRKLGEGALYPLEDVEKRLQRLIQEAKSFKVDGNYPVKQKTSLVRK